MTTSQRTMTMSPGATAAASECARRIFSARVFPIDRDYYQRSVRVNGFVPEYVPTAELADAAGVPIAMDNRIRPLWPAARLAGPAFTVRTPPGEHPSVREAADAAPPGSVIVVDGGGAVDCALWGDKLAKLALDRGIAGLVVDGAVRDAEGIEELGFPVFAAAITPTPPRREEPGEVGIPVTCGGLTVRPGDRVYGDRDGVVVVPAGRHDEILGRVREALRV
jgi:4-hydroxy-4-methyl-2-oxoglutarate aldolase